MKKPAFKFSNEPSKAMAADDATEEEVQSYSVNIVLWTNDEKEELPETLRTLSSSCCVHWIMLSVESITTIEHNNVSLSASGKKRRTKRRLCSMDEQASNFALAPKLHEEQSIDQLKF